LTKYCPKCGRTNDESSKFCKNCGEKLPGIHSMNSNRINNDNNNSNNGNKNILIGLIVVLLIAIAVIGTYAFVALNNDSANTSTNEVSNSSVNEVSSVDTKTKTWHKVDSYSGVGDKTITLNSGGNPIRVTSSAMPIKNYADNFMETIVTHNGYTVGSSLLSWNSKSAVATKSDSIEFSGSGTFYIYVSTYELQYWNLDIYEYY